MRPRSYFSVAIAALMMSACAFPNDQGREEQRRRYIQEENLQREDVAPLEGLWGGTLTRGTDIIQVELLIQLTPVDTGQRTATGDRILRYDPQGTFRSTSDARYPFQSFAGIYVKETAALTFNATNMPVVSSGQQPAQTPTAGQNGSMQTSPDTPRTLEFNFDGANLRLNGVLTSVSGNRVGSMVLTRRTGSTASSEQDAEDIQNQLLREQLQPLVGNFFGSVDEPGTNKPFGVCLNISLAGQATSSGRERPILRATYNRYDVATEALRRTLDITYNVNTTPHYVFMTSAGQNTTFPGNYTVEISGRFQNGKGTPTLNEIIGTHRNVNLGPVGQLDLKRVSRCPAVPQPREVPPPNTPPIMVNPGDVLNPGHAKPPRRGKARHRKAGAEIPIIE